MTKIIADIVFMCRIFAEIHARSFLVSITGEVGLGRAFTSYGEGDNTCDDHMPLSNVECLLNLIWRGKISPCWSLAYYVHNSKEAYRLCPQKVQLEFHSLGLSWPGFWRHQKSWNKSFCLLSLAKQILFGYFEFRKNPGFTWVRLLWKVENWQWWGFPFLLL